MKNKLLKSFFAACITSTMMLQIMPFGYGGIEVKAEPINKWGKLEEKKSLRFAVLSDTHVGPSQTNENKRLKEVFSTVYELDPEMDAVAIVGDITDNGFKSEYDIFKNIVSENKKEETELVVSMGNHEGNTAEMFKEATGNNPRDNRVINGYHFITLSPRLSENVYGEDRYNLDEQWLKEQLDAATLEDPTKPVFLFLHHGIKDTAYGTDEWCTPDLQTLLKSYPQVVQFAGHSHYPLNDPRSIHQKDFTAINTATTSYFELEKGMMYGTVPPNAGNAAQMMVLDVDGTKVSIKKLDLISGEYIGEDWVFDTALGKEGFKYTDNRSENSQTPYFSDDAVVKIDEVNENGCKITIDQALIKDVKGDNHDEIVHSYKYDFINKKTGKVDKSYKIWSEYYFLPMSNKLTQDFSGLKPGTEYEVVVTGLSSYKKATSNPIRASFKTEGGFIPPTDDEMQIPVDPAEIMSVDFKDGIGADNSETKNELKISGSPQVMFNEELNKNVGSFNGNSAFMYPFSDETYSKIKKNLTLESVFKVEPFNGDYVDVFSNMESAGTGFEVAKIEGDTENASLEFWIRIRGINIGTGTGSYVKVAGNIKYGEYVHAMATYDGKRINLYINGELENSKEVSGEVYYPTGAAKVFCIGSDISGSGQIQSPMVGEVSVAKIYSRTLNAVDAYKLHYNELINKNNKTSIILNNIENIDGKVGTEINMPVIATSLPSDKNIRSAEMVFNIPNDLEVKSVELNKNNINSNNFDYNVVDGKLRIALTNIDGTPLFVNTTVGEKVVANIKFEVKEEKEDGESTNVETEKFVLRCDENVDVDYEVKDAVSTISFVKSNQVQAFARELYVSSGTDVIEAGYKAYAIEFVGADKNLYVKSNNENKIYYNEEFTAKNNKLTYVTLVPGTIGKEELENMTNYELTDRAGESDNAITFGDIKNDGIDAQDALATVSSWLRKSEINNKEMLIINVSGDGAINTRDSIEVVDKFVSGKEFTIISK